MANKAIKAANKEAPKVVKVDSAVIVKDQLDKVANSKQAVKKINSKKPGAVKVQEVVINK